MLIDKNNFEQYTNIEDLKKLKLYETIPTFLDHIEEELINTLIPPINDKYARTEISVALKQAFLI